jgi:lectin, mannose-binding 2
VYCHISLHQALPLTLSSSSRYANSRHSYSFPRLVGMLGDAKTSYDHANDGEGTNIGACSANYRRTNVATKVKITYMKDTMLSVRTHFFLVVL